MVSTDELLLILLREAELRTTHRAEYNLQLGLLQLLSPRENLQRIALIVLEEDVLRVTCRSRQGRTQQQFSLHTDLDAMLTAIADAIVFVNSL